MVRGNASPAKSGSFDDLCATALSEEIEMSRMSDTQSPLPGEPKGSGTARASLPALLSGSFCVVAALGLVVGLVLWIAGSGGIVVPPPPPEPPPVFVTFKVHWEDTKYVNETRDAEGRGRVAYQDNGYAYVEASKADLDLTRIEGEIGNPVKLPGSWVGGLASYKISFVSSTCGGSSDDCQKIIDLGSGTFLLRFNRGSLKLDHVKDYAPGAGSRLESADPAGIVQLSKRY